MSKVELKQIRYSYSDGIQALDNIDLTIDSGSRIALVGPNGAGKTSLLLALANLIDVQGSVRIDGTLMSAETAASLRNKMSYVFQNPDEMLFMPTVIEDVCFGLDALGLAQEEIMDRALASLDRVSLSGFDSRSSHHLSYGERRRVCLATCLARKSSLTVFDEPTRELDPHGRRQFIDLFKKMEGTLLLATHDLELVLETCDELVLIDNGAVISRGKPAEILADKELMEAHRLEVPHSLMQHPHAHR